MELILRLFFSLALPFVNSFVTKNMHILGELARNHEVAQIPTCKDQEVCCNDIDVVYSTDFVSAFSNSNQPSEIRLTVT